MEVGHRNSMTRVIGLYKRKMLTNNQYLNQSPFLSEVLYSRQEFSCGFISEEVAETLKKILKDQHCDLLIKIQGALNLAVSPHLLPTISFHFPKSLISNFAACQLVLNNLNRQSNFLYHVGFSHLVKYFRGTMKRTVTVS